MPEEVRIPGLNREHKGSRRQQLIVGALAFAVTWGGPGVFVWHVVDQKQELNEAIAKAKNEVVPACQVETARFVEGKGSEYYRKSGSVVVELTVGFSSPLMTDLPEHDYSTWPIIEQRLAYRGPHIVRASYIDARHKVVGAPSGFRSQGATSSFQAVMREGDAIAVERGVMATVYRDTIANEPIIENFVATRRCGQLSMTTDGELVIANS